MDGRNPRLLPGKSIDGIPCARADDTQARVGAPYWTELVANRLPASFKTPGGFPVKQRCPWELFPKKWKLRFATFWFWCWKRQVWGWFDAIWKALWMYFLMGKLIEDLSVVGLHVNTSQVRAGLHASGEPVLGRKRKRHPICTTVIYMRQQETNKLKCDFHTTSSGTASLHIHLNTLRTKNLITMALTDGMFLDVGCGMIEAVQGFGYARRS